MCLTYSAIVVTYIPPILKSLKEEDTKSATGSASAPSTDSAPASAVNGAATAPASGPAIPASQGSRSASGGAVTDMAHARPMLTLLSLAALFAFACAAPFLAGAQNFMGWIIIAIGLYQAWKMNRRVRLEVSGPFSVSTQSAGA